MTGNYQLEWTMELKQTYRIVVPEGALPQEVQYALASGFDLDEIACGCSNRHLSENGGGVLDQAFRALESFVSSREDEPDETGVPDLDVVTFSADSSPSPPMRKGDSLRNSPRFWMNEHSDLL